MHVPQKVTCPEKPVFELYDTEQPIASTKNFARLQRNTIKLVNYNNQLRDVVEYYETQVDQLSKLQKSIDTKKTP